MAKRKLTRAVESLKNHGADAGMIEQAMADVRQILLISELRRIHIKPEAT